MKKAELLRIELFLKENHISEQLYSIGEYAEESVCLLYNGEQFEVFVAEKGNKYNCHRYHTILDAGVDLILRLARNKAQEESLLEKWKKFI